MFKYTVCIERPTLSDGGTVSKLRVAICISDEIWVPMTTTTLHY